MAGYRAALIALSGLMLSAATRDATTSAAEPPKINKPIPVPDRAPNMPALPHAVIDPSLEIGGDQVEARKVETRLTVEVLVNDVGPYQFIVDSGADTSVVGLRIAQNLELPLGKPIVLNSMTSRHIVDRVKVAKLTVGPTTVKDLHLPALREADMGGDGMIGIDALVAQRLMMDFEKRHIKVEDARVPYKSRPGEIVITARRQRGQLILAHVTAAGYPLDAVIDTGSQVTIGNFALRDKLIRKNRDKFVTVPVTGVTGAVQNMQFATIRELQLGPIVFYDVPMAFADVPPFQLFGLSDEPALLLGTDLLETFRRISLDFHSRKVRFQLRRCRPEAVVIATRPEAMTRISSTGDPAVCTRR